MKGRTYRYLPEKPLYGFGFGLSYTKFADSGLRIAKAANAVKAGESVTVEADVKHSRGNPILFRPASSRSRGK